MYVIGIDISKYKHDCIIINEDTGEIVRDVFSFDNSRTGFDQFLEVLNALDPNVKKKIGFEATGHYQDNLKIFLENNGLEFMELNSLLVHKFKSSQTLRGVKTDKTDARLIARYLCNIEFKPYPRVSYHTLALRSLCKRHFDLINERTKYLIRITNFLDRTFPELKSFLKGNIKSNTMMFLLRNYGIPSKIANMNIQSYDLLRKTSQGKVSVARFYELKELAKNTVGFSYETDVFEIQSLLRSYDLIQEEISLVETKISSHMSKINSKIPTIKGIGLVSAATIIAEIEDISRFDNPNKLLAFSGLDPRLYESGTQSFKGRMNKKGSVVLRRVLMNAAEICILYYPTFYEYYRRKREEGKAHRVALSHLARKLVRIIYKVETEHIDFDLSLVK
ncbi:MAG: IS110 family transposase [Saccharofermentans sp.]|nr:IS110 family transposase [Saccharofermentans sp.]